MRPKYKLAILIAVAALTMTALAVVNLQASQDTGPRRPSVSIAEEMHRPGAVWS